MSFRPIERVFQWLRLSGPELGVSDPEALVQRGRTHFLEDFPNSSGDDCISAGVLNALIDSATLPSDEIREHLLTCSVCFAHYRDELARHRAAASSVAATQSPSLLKTRLVPLVGASVAGIIIIAAITFVALKRDVGPAQTVASVNSKTNTTNNSLSHDQPNAATTPSPETNPERATSDRSQQPSHNSRQLIARNNVDIDLETHNPVRGPNDSPSLPIELRRMHNELTLKLPAGSPKGEYEVSLANPYGRYLKTVKAVSPDGMRLRLGLNLSSVKPGNYLICLGRQTEVPQCVLATVGSARKKNK